MYTFVGSPLEAVEAARQVAGDRSVDVFSSSIGNELLRAGAVDEIHLYVAPVLFGAGTPLAGEREFIVFDPDLADRLARAASTGR